MKVFSAQDNCGQSDITYIYHFLVPAQLQS